MQWFLRQCSAILLQAIGYRAIYLLSQQNLKYYVAQQAVLPLCIKFIYSEKATRFCKIFTLLLSYVVPVKSKVKISQRFVAFSEYMNFTYQGKTETETRLLSCCFFDYNQIMIYALEEQKERRGEKLQALRFRQWHMQVTIRFSSCVHRCNLFRLRIPHRSTLIARRR